MKETKEEKKKEEESKEEEEEELEEGVAMGCGFVFGPLVSPASPATISAYDPSCRRVWDPGNQTESLWLGWAPEMMGLAEV